MRQHERGSVMVVGLILIFGVAAFSSVFLGRTLHERNRNNTQSNSLKALFNAYGKLAKAEAVLNRAWYDPVTGRNLKLLDALESPDQEIEGTGVRVEMIGDPDDTYYFNLVAEDTVGRVTRVVQALMSERESFASFNYFVNSHPLGISGTNPPRGSIHTNRRLDFYFADGTFVDPVTACEGFLFVAGATSENTTFLGPAEPNVPSIDELAGIDIPAMEGSSIYSVTDPQLESKIFLEGDQARVQKFTKAGWEEVPRYSERWVVVDEWEVEVTREVPVYVTETYTVTVPIYEEEIYTYMETVPIWEEQEVERTRDVPVYAERTVIEQSTELVWVPDDDPEAVGGTAIAGGDGGQGPGHWEQQIVEYETTETYLDHYDTETYMDTEWVQTGTEEVEREDTRDVQVGEQEEERTREVVDHYETVTETEIERTWEQETYLNGTRWEWQPSEFVGEDVVVPDGILYVAGDVIALEGTLDGRLTIACDGSVDVTGSIVYEDGEGQTAYLNGDDPDLPYEPNPDYVGNSVLGIIAENDIRYTNDVPTNFELNGSLLARQGRVGITGIQLDNAGEATLSGSGDYLKNSFRRLGGIITNLRPVSTFIDEDYVPRAGFLRGQSIYDRMLQFRPPKGFPGRRRPKKIAMVMREVVQ